MNPESAAADQMLRMELMVTEAAVRLAASGAVNLAALLIAVLRGEKQVSGKMSITNLLKEGKPLTTFPLQADKMKQFAGMAKEQGIKCSLVRDQNNPDTVDVIIKEEDAQRANMILDRIGAKKEVAEKNGLAGPSGIASGTSGYTMENGSGSMTQPTNLAPELTDKLLGRLGEISSALKYGADPAQCKAALRDIQNELGDALGMPAREKSAAADKGAEQKTAGKAGKKSVRERIGEIRSRAAHEPQHLKPKVPTPGKTITNQSPMK